jgi:hypothetical protein
MPSTKTILATLAVVVHSFTPAFAASPVADAADPLITPAPTRTVAKRGEVAGASGTPILSTLTFAYTALPYQVYPYPVLRGPQFGFNQCNSTTLGATSNCQTLVFNSPDDFCLWGSPDASGSIGDVEAKVVAYCTKPYHGTRLIPPGAITGLQWVKTSAYIQAVGFISNSGIGLADADKGGELDPHGADLQGNPLGGVVYSNGTTDGDGKALTQVMNWNTFVGGGQFCFKACFNSVTSPDYCENRYDLIGCSYNMPSAAKDGEFLECDSDLQDPAGIYTSNGAVMTYTMPDPLVDAPPYTPRVPSSSNCKTHASTDLFLAASTTSGAASATATPSGTGKQAAGASGSRTGSAGGAASTSTGSTTSGASGLRVPAAGALVLMVAGALAVAL